MTVLSTNSLRVLDIVDGTIVDGPGLRTSIYLAGCSHHCEGCHNPQSWDHQGGRLMTIDRLIDHIKENEFNVTLTGGDPLYQIDGVKELCRRIRQMGLTIWLYTGFTYEQVCADPRLAQILSVIDVMVDGPFIQSLRDTSLRFRGSSNQRIIAIPSSTPAAPSLLHLDE